MHQSFAVFFESVQSLEEFKKNILVKENNARYTEIEFVCCNPEYPNATDPETQLRMFERLKKIEGAIPLLQDWDDGQTSLSVVYSTPNVGKEIKNAARQIGIEIDLIQNVDDNYVDRIIRGEHDGQVNQISHDEGSMNKG
jgi:hypothetical protein